MAVYVPASMSMLAMGLSFIGLLVFALFHLKVNGGKLPLVMMLLTLVLAWGYFQYEKNTIGFKFGFLAQSAAVSEQTQTQIDFEKLNQAVPNVGERIKYWKYYVAQVTSSPEAFLLGVEEPPDRAKYPSAHNYYLDFVYNFGALALLPMCLLIGYTVLQMYRRRRDVFGSPALLGLCLVVLFLLGADNSLKVGLRQPYPGIFTFFLWGVLLTALSKTTKDMPQNKSLN